MKVEESEVGAGDQERFEKYSPLVALLLFSFGPSSAFIQACLDSMETAQIAARFKNDESTYAMEIIGCSVLILQCTNYVGTFFCQALTGKISRLLGEGSREMAQQVVADVTRLAILSSFVFAGTFIFAVKPFLRFIGVDEKLIDPAFQYCFVFVMGAPAITAFNMVFGFLQSIGRPGWAFAVRVSAYLVQVLVVTPFLLFVVKLPFYLIKISQIFVEIVAPIIVCILVAKGRVNMTVPWKHWISLPIRESGHAVMLAASTILQFVSMVVPPTLVLRSMLAIDPDYKDAISATVGVWNKMYIIAFAVTLTFGVGFLTAGTHALGMKRYKRFIRLFWWAFTFTMVPLGIFVSIMVLAPASIAKLFLKGDQVEYAAQILLVPFRTYILQGFVMISVMGLIALGKPLFPIIFGILQCVILCVGAEVAKRTVDEGAYKVMYIYNLADVIGSLLYGITLSVYMFGLRNKGDEDDYVALESDKKEN